MGCSLEKAVGRAETLDAVLAERTGELREARRERDEARCSLEKAVGRAETLDALLVERTGELREAEDKLGSVRSSLKAAVMAFVSKGKAAVRSSLKAAESRLDWR